MNKLKRILLSIGVFLVAVVLAFYFENSYRTMVRFFFSFFLGGKISFTGKNFHLFPSGFFLSSFGIYSVLLCWLLLQRNNKKLLFILLSVLLFFITTMVTSYLDSAAKLAVCTACKDDNLQISYNGIGYDKHFVCSLLISLLPLGLAYLKRQRSK